MRMKAWFCALTLMACGVAADTAEDALVLAQRTLTYVERSVKRPEMASELAALAERLPQAN